MRILNAQSVGCVDYGNNNFFEIMVNDSTGEVVLCSHDDCGFTENPDGTFNCDGLSLREFALEIKDRPDYKEIMEEIAEQLK